MRSGPKRTVELEVDLLSQVSEARTVYYDVVVCGSGMAGLCAAITAIERGAKVLVIEKGPQPGGSMAMSGGTLWTGATLDDMVRWVPEGDPGRMRVVVTEMEEGACWLQRLGLKMEPLPARSDRQGYQFLPPELVHLAVARIRRGGGEVACDTAISALTPHGVIVESRGQWLELTAKSTILATGGFQASRDLLKQYVLPQPENVFLRSNPHSSGAGLTAALAMGAATSPHMDSFYGHTMALTSDDPMPDRWTSLTQYYSQHCVLVNLRGERFFDESLSKADELAPQAIARQPEGRAVMLFDHHIFTTGGDGTYDVAEKWEVANHARAYLAQRPTIEELAQATAAWGVDPDGLLRTISEYNRGIFRVPRHQNQWGLMRPPFYALAVRAGITFTLGGLATDLDGRVLRPNGQPIPGLLAAGADAGGTYHRGYMGGLALGLVFGRRAGRAAVPA